MPSSNIKRWLVANKKQKKFWRPKNVLDFKIAGPENLPCVTIYWQSCVPGTLSNLSMRPISNTLFLPSSINVSNDPKILKVKCVIFGELKNWTATSSGFRLKWSFTLPLGVYWKHVYLNMLSGDLDLCIGTRWQFMGFKTLYILTNIHENCFKSRKPKLLYYNITFLRRGLSIYGYTLGL